MRARNLKPGLFKNPELADAGPHAQLLFAGLWLLADKEGRLKDQPRVIKAELFPYYEVDVNRELTVIERLGHIHRYVASGIAVIEVCNFKKHQSPHHTEKASELPACTCEKPCAEGVREIHREVTVKSPLDDGGNPSDSLIPDSLIHPEEAAAKKGRKPRAKPPEDDSWKQTQNLAVDAFASFIAYRTAKAKRLLPQSVRTLANKLAALPASVQVELIELTIANGWQGIQFDKAAKMKAAEDIAWR